MFSMVANIVRKMRRLNSEEVRSPDPTTVQDLCVWYFILYLPFLVATKYFVPNIMTDVYFVIYTTISGTITASIIVVAKGWVTLPLSRTNKNRYIPPEVICITLSAFCSALIIPITTLLYISGVSVLVAMIIMRSSVICFGRIIDVLHTRQVSRYELMALVLSVGALLLGLFGSAGKDYVFIKSSWVMGLLITYVVAYFFRLYIYSYYKKSRSQQAFHDSRGYFGVEQLVLTGILLVGGLTANHFMGQESDFHKALLFSHPHWISASFAGVFFGLMTPFSVLLFLHSEENATTSILANRITSILAGTVATLISAIIIPDICFPSCCDWFAFTLLLGAFILLHISDQSKPKGNI
jgi:hypothetical protein